VTSDAPARLSRPDAARYLGLSIGTLRNYHREGKLIPEPDERGQWWYPLATLDEFAAANVLLCARGERARIAPPSILGSGPQRPEC
jgi:hypothetical protein